MVFSQRWKSKKGVDRLANSISEREVITFCLSYWHDFTVDFWLVVVQAQKNLKQQIEIM